MGRLITIFLILFLLSVGTATAQQQLPQQADSVLWGGEWICRSVDEPVRFEGDDDLGRFFDWTGLEFARRMRRDVSPDFARFWLSYPNLSIPGPTVSFIVDTMGRVRNIRVVVPYAPTVDSCAVAAVVASSGWTPARKFFSVSDGSRELRPVPVLVAVPIRLTDASSALYSAERVNP